jgi:hypothetical protein
VTPPTRTSGLRIVSTSLAASYVKPPSVTPWRRLPWLRTSGMSRSPGSTVMSRSPA